MATPSAEDQKAAQLAWERRQSARLSQGRDSLRTMGGAAGGGGFSARNMLALNQNSARGGKPAEQKLREEGGKQLGRWAGGALAGFLTAGFGAPIGAFLGGFLGKKVGGSIVGKIALIGLVIASILLAIAVPIAGLFAICNQYKLTLTVASYVNNNANSLYTVCKSFTP